MYTQLAAFILICKTFVDLLVCSSDTFLLKKKLQLNTSNQRFCIYFNPIIIFTEKVEQICCDFEWKLNVEYFI